MATFRVEPITDIQPELLRDLNIRDNTHAVIRESESRGDIVWSFHKSQKLAQAAMRRWRRRVHQHRLTPPSALAVQSPGQR